MYSLPTTQNLFPTSEAEKSVEKVFERAMADVQPTMREGDQAAGISHES